jgi:predicted anti-sigma-YlaC factor YlaD
MSAIAASAVCQRVRAQVSLRLDDELSQLEGRMVDAHLVRCANCRAYAADLTMFTDEMRSAPLETLERPVVVERRRRLALARVQGGVAAAIAIVAIGVTGQQIASSGKSDAHLPTSAGTITRFPTQAELDRELAILEKLPTRRTASMGSTTL